MSDIICPPTQNRSNGELLARFTGELPANASLGSDTVLTGDRPFARFRSTQPQALVIGDHCTMDDVQFAVGKDGRVQIGNYCYFNSVVLLSEAEVRIGSYVVIGWNTTITDSDFHPIAPAQRIQDVIACSTLGQGRPRLPGTSKPVCIEDDVWIGPSVTILKGVCIGAGSFIESGTLLTRSVPPRSRVLGNPAQIIGTV